MYWQLITLIYSIVDNTGEIPNRNKIAIPFRQLKYKPIIRIHSNSETLTIIQIKIQCKIGVSYLSKLTNGLKVLKETDMFLV